MSDLSIEATIAEQHVTRALVDEIRARVRLEVLEETGASGAATENVDTTHRDKIIPQLLQATYDGLILNRLWAALREHNDPTIDFKKLRKHAVHWTKRHAEDLFR